MSDIPCGSCAAGIYDIVPITNGAEMFGHCQTQKQALREAPRCKKDGKHICFGARDFIVSAQFPFEKHSFLKDIGAA